MTQTLLAIKTLAGKKGLVVGIANEHSITSSLRSPFSYLETKDCGFSSRLANSACVTPIFSRA